MMWLRLKRAATQGRLRGHMRVVRVGVMMVVAAVMGMVPLVVMVMVMVWVVMRPAFRLAAAAAATAAGGLEPTLVHIAVISLVSIGWRS